MIATGDDWTAQESVTLDLGPVDSIGASNQYLLEQNRKSDLVFFTHHRSLWEEGMRTFTRGGRWMEWLR